jgi:hypothetical protein
VGDADPEPTAAARGTAPTAIEPPIPQLTLGGVLGVWAAAALPMAVLAWVVAPWLADGLSGPAALPRALIVTLTAGLVWQFVLVLALVHREQRTLRWPVLRDALWLRAPRDPRTGRRGGRAWLVVPVLIVAFAAEQLVPGLPHLEGRDLGVFLWGGKSRWTSWRSSCSATRRPGHQTREHPRLVRNADALAGGVPCA